METSVLHVLIVDDSPEDRYALRRLLDRAAPGRYAVTEVDCGDDALAACRAAPPGCVLLDYRLPDMDGLAVLAALRAQGDVPVVMLTGVGSETVAVEALQHGAQDYLVKGALTPERLSLTIQHAVATVRLTRERDQSLALLTAVLDTLPVGVMVLDAGLRLQRGNPALLATLGQPAAPLAEQALPQLWPGLAAELAAPCAQALGGTPFSEREIALPAAAGHAARRLAVSGVPLCDPHGAGPLALLTIQDVTARRQAAAAAQAAAERLHVLAAAAHAFTEVAMDEAALLDRIARLTAEPLAAICTIWCACAGAQALHVGAVYDSDPAVRELVRAGFAAAPIPAAAPHPAAVVARSGLPLRIPAVDPAAMRAALTPEHWAVFERVRPQSVIAVPLLARGATLGCLVFSRHRAGQPAFTEDDLTLAQDLADRAALALTNARLYQQAQAAQQAATEALARLDALIRSVPSGIGYLDRDLRYQLVNPALAAINHRAIEEHLGQAPQALNPGLAPRLEPLMRQVLETGEPVRDLELHGQSCPLDGEPHDWLISYFPVRGPAGAVTGVGVTVTDVTASKRTAAALRDTERKLGALFALLPVGISIIDAAGALAYVNPAAERIMRMDRARLLAGEHRAYVYRQADGAPLPLADHAALRAFLAHQAVTDLELAFTTEAGEEVWTSISTVPVDFPDWRVVMVTTDITTRKQAEVALRASEERHAFLLRLSDRLRPLDAPEAIQFEAACALGEHLGVSRVGYAEDQADDETIVVTRNYTNGVAGIAGRYHYDDYGPELLRAFRAGHAVVRPDIASDPTLTAAEKAAHAALQLGATLNVPLLKAGRLVAVLFMHHHTARAWSAADRTLLEDVAARTWDAVERARAEAALRASEARYRILFETMAQGVIVYDSTGRDLIANPAAEHIFGRSYKDLRGGFAAHPDWLVTREDGTALTPEEHPVRIALQTGCAVGDLVLGVTTLDTRATRWVRAQVIPRRYAGTTAVEQAYAIFEDITERKAHEAALQAAYAELETHAARLNSLLAHAPVGISLLDTALRFQQINASLAAMNGISPAAHLGRTIGEVLPALAPTLEPIYRRVIATGEPLLDQEISGETPATPGAQRVWRVSYFPVRGTSAAILGVGAVVLDVTAQRQAEQARDAAHQQLEAVVESLDEGVIAMRPDGALVVINRAARAWMLADPSLRPRTVRELSAMNRMALSDPAGQALAGDALPFMRALRGEGFRNWELRLRPARAAAERWVLISGAMAPPVEGRPALIVVTLSDITERKRAELALAAHVETLSKTNADLARALQLKDEFLAMMSHELRTPLNVVLGVTEALEEELYGPIADRQRQALDTIAQSGRHLLAILSDILDLAHIEAGKAALDAQAIDVDALCRTALQFVQARAQAKGVQLFRSVAGEVAGLRGDERRLIQILTNLLDNAVKFTPAGGRAGLEVATAATQECITFTVWDTGIGIAPADMDRLFQPFTQVDGRLSRAYGGIGLGLTLVRRLADMHGGSVGLESTFGQGSRFSVSLPWSPAENVAPQPPRAAAPAQPHWARPPRLVIADDHEGTLQFYAELLGAQGCPVALARTGVEAVAQVRAARPDVS